MADVMRRGRSQVLWKYTPHASWRFNDDAGWCQTTEVTLRDVKSLDGVLAEAISQALDRWKAIGTGGFPDPQHQVNRYVVGEPHHVMYDVWPTVFECRRCGRIHYYRDVAALVRFNGRLGCRTCKGEDQLRPVPYAYVCECGRINSVYIPKHDQDHTITLVNRGSFQESFWFCRTCRIPLQKNSRAGLGFRPCDCRPKKGMRGILLEDGRIYYSQTIDLVDIAPEVLGRWKGNARFSDLLLAAALHANAYRPEHIQDLAAWKPLGTDLSPEMRAMRDILVQQGMSESQAEMLVRQGAAKAGADPWVSYDRGLADHRAAAGLREWSESRRSVEYVFVRDEKTAGTLTLDTLIAEAESAGDSATARRLASERVLASDMGITGLAVVSSLPILLASYGYSRYFTSPREAAEADGTTTNVREVSLRPFPEQDGKTPIYVARNTSEALMYELDPWQLAAFLELNANLAIPSAAVASDSALRSWLLGSLGNLIDRGESHLLLESYEHDAGLEVDEPTALAFGVLHSVSHVLKVTAHRYVGIDEDSLAEYLFAAHGAGLLYVSSHVEFTLGGIDAVFRANLTQWLGTAREYARQCSFDPVCTRAGGACMACLYPKFGCSYFNRTVSRSFLFGGKVNGRKAPLVGYWSRDVTLATRALRLRSSPTSEGEIPLVTNP